MHRLAFPLCVAFLAMLPLCFTACGKKKPAGMPSLNSVQITVKLGSEPLADALVEMVGTGENGAWQVGGRTDENGVVDIYTRGEYRGAPEGEYVILVTKMNKIEGPTSRKPAPTDPAKLVAYRSKCDKERKMVPAVASIFSNREKTPLKATVAKGGNKFDFTVEPFKAKGR